MNEEKRVQILHDLKRLAELIAEWQKNDEEYRQRILRAFDTLYKDLENELVDIKHNKGNTDTDNA